MGDLVGREKCDGERNRVSRVNGKIVRHIDLRANNTCAWLKL